MFNMIKILYIGNKLSQKNTNITTIETLGNHLIGEGYNVVYSSTRINKLFRVIDMLFAVIKNRKKAEQFDWDHVKKKWNNLLN